ncbi:hypothetical protein EV426DRAFT_590952 [Tirmania nivea]|nr:hypothetical protein EV426DRAFT_590952 [Tirmania nivea]
MSMSAASQVIPANAGQLVCRPSAWTDIAKFFLLNYGLHAVTVITPPGTRPIGTIFTILTAVFIPCWGILTALDKFERGAGRKRGASELDIAHSAGALCMVWARKPTEGNCYITHISPALVNVHGQHPVPTPRIFTWPWRQRQPERLMYQNPRRTEDLRLIGVPATFKVHPIIPDPFNEIKLSSNYNIPKAVAAVLQILYASFELYATGERQIKQWGYAAYSFTVIPYICMSLINLLASVFEPQYSTMYLVVNEYGPSAADPQDGTFGKPEGEREEKLGGPIGRAGATPGDHFPDRETIGAGKSVAKRLGALCFHLRRPNYLHNNIGCAREPKFHQMVMPIFKSLIYVGVLAAPYLAMSILTHWEKGESSELQRSWIVTWLGTGGGLGSLVQVLTMHTELKDDPVRKLQLSYIYVFLLSIPPMGMFIIVGKMLAVSEVCRLA